MAVAWLRFLSECLILNYRQCPVSVTLEVDVSQHQRWTWPVTCENSLDLFFIWSPGGPTPIGRSPWSVHIKNVGPHPVWTWAAINKSIQKKLQAGQRYLLLFLRIGVLIAPTFSSTYISPSFPPERRMEDLKDTIGSNRGLCQSSVKVCVVGGTTATHHHLLSWSHIVIVDHGPYRVIAVNPILSPQYVQVQWVSTVCLGSTK